MQKARKEEIRKHKAARAGKTNSEIAVIEQAEQAQAELNSLAKCFHRQLFPEEYDFMQDSLADSKIRSQGKNPMSQEYISEVTARRAALGVSPLGEDGHPTNRESWEYAYALAKENMAEISADKNIG